MFDPIILGKGGSMFLVIRGNYHEFYDTKKEAVKAIEDYSTHSMSSFVYRLFEISKEHEFNIIDVEEKREVTETVSKVEFTDV